MANRQKISFGPSIRRLPSYLHVIRQAQQNGDQYISGTVIAAEQNLEPIQVRKDLAITGIIGKPKKGYPVNELIEAIESYLGWNLRHCAIVVGGEPRLCPHWLSGIQEPRFEYRGRIRYRSFESGFQRPWGSHPSFRKNRGNRSPDKGRLAILTVPSPFAVSTCESIVKAGIKSIWNFTNIKLKVPEVCRCGGKTCLQATPCSR
jgi:redox-sensing transcriptional repressor